MEPNFDLFEARLRSAIGSEPLYGWAVRMGINKASLNSAMTRRTLPKVELLMLLSTALGCSVDWLLGADAQTCAPPVVPMDDLIKAQLASAMEEVSANMKNRLGLSTQAGLTPDEKHVLQAYRQADAKGKQAYLGLADALGKRRNGG